MSLNPINVRLPQFDLESEEGRQAAHRYLASGIVDLNQAIAYLKANPQSSTTTTIVQGGTGGGGGGTVQSIGGVNDQIGVTAYTTQQSDYGTKIIVGDSSAITITLNGSITTPWFTIIDNDSSSVASLVPSSPYVLDGETRIDPRCFAIIYFDGANFWCGASKIATPDTVGYVKPDNTTIEIDSSGTISVIPAASGNATFFLDSGASDVVGYQSLIPAFPTGAEVTYTAVGNAGSGQVLAAEFVGPLGGMSLNLIPAGMWIPSLFLAVDSLAQGPQAVVKVYTRTSGGVETLQLTQFILLTSTAVTFYDTSTELTNVSVSPTDRLVVKVYLLAGGSSTRTLTLYVDGTTHNSHIHIPASVINSVQAEFVNSQTGTTYTIQPSDRRYLLTFNNASPVAVTLPQAGVNYPNGWFCDVVNLGAGTATITPTTSTINLNPSVTRTTGQGGRIVSDGSNYYFVGI